ncbi:MAG: ACP S-malonyltransferase [Planctomycetota bacterium]
MPDNKIALLFPGQGAQAVGMGKELCQNHPTARKIFERANQILGFDLSKLCFEGPEDQLNKTNICQPALLVTSIAELEVLKEQSKLPQFSALAGLSLGEYTALAAGNALSFDDAVRIVERRGTFMQEACDQHPSGMAAVMGIPLDKIKEVIGSINGVIGVANLNTPGQVVISGDNKAIEKASAKLKEAGARKVIPLKVAGAFHSPLMKSAEDKLKIELQKINIKPPTMPIISNVTADYVTDPARIKNNLARQVVSSVLWEASMRKLIQDGFKTFYEIGSGNTLTGMMQRIDSTVQCTKL